MVKAIVLAGGVGSRLWPLSREEYPKQFLKLFDGESLFQLTVKRLLPIFGPDNILVSTGKRYRFIVSNQLEEMKLEFEKDQLVVEPEAKSTLPALLLAMHRFGEDVYGVFPSDHAMNGAEEFRRSVDGAVRLARSHIATLGIVPTRPHTGYGYIKPGEPVGDGYRVERFVEKPDLETARRYVKEGYYWNAGMLFARTSLFVKEVEKYCPENLAVFEEGEAGYGSAKGVSMEYGVVEKTKKAAVVPYGAYWNDLGSFSSFFEIMNNGKGVATNTEVVDLDSRDNLVLVDGRKLVSLVDVNDLVVVDTRDALLIGSRKSSQRVKEVFKFLKGERDMRARRHTTVYRPWGFFTYMENNDSSRVKKVVIYPGKRMTLHRHYHRSEHWVVVRGVAEIELDGKKLIVGPGESTYVPRGAVHLLRNPGRVPLEMIEVQIGEYLSEDDVKKEEEGGVEDL